jgi:hypothetical protein
VVPLNSFAQDLGWAILFVFFSTFSAIFFETKICLWQQHFSEEILRELQELNNFVGW